MDDEGFSGNWNTSKPVSNFAVGGGGINRERGGPFCKGVGWESFTEQGP